MAAKYTLPVSPLKVPLTILMGLLGLSDEGWWQGWGLLWLSRRKNQTSYLDLRDTIPLYPCITHQRLSHWHIGSRSIVRSSRESRRHHPRGRRWSPGSNDGEGWAEKFICFIRAGLGRLSRLIKLITWGNGSDPSPFVYPQDPQGRIPNEPLDRTWKQGERDIAFKTTGHDSHHSFNNGAATCTIHPPVPGRGRRLR